MTTSALKNISIVNFFSFIFLCNLIGACGQAQDNISPFVFEPPLHQVAQPLFAENSSFYENFRIPVCFMNSMPDPNAVIALQSAVMQQYEMKTKTHFTYWGTCPAPFNQPGIRISVQDSNNAPHTYSWGTAGWTSSLPDTPGANMVLNFSFLAGWAPSCSQNGNAYRNYCIGAIGVHEFGHALSALHEQQRPDTDPNCTALMQSDPNNAAQSIQYAANGNKSILPANAPWDSNSTMSYCNPKWNNDGILSDADIRGWQNVYGSSKSTLDTATGFGPTDSTWAFSMKGMTAAGNRNYDLIGILYGAATGSGKIEIHAVSQSSTYQTFNTHLATPLPNTDTWTDDDYKMGYIDGDNIADMIVVHNGAPFNNGLTAGIWSGSSGFQTAIVGNTSTPLASNSAYHFAVGDWNADGVDDLFAIAPASTYMTVWVMSGATKFGSVLTTGNIPMNPTIDSRCKWIVGDFNNDGKSDLTCMLTTDTASGYLEIHSFDGASGFATENVAVQTQIQNVPYSYADFSFIKATNCSPNSYLGCSGNIAWIKKNGVSTEVHILDASLYF